jgi:hypothetical protein
LLDFSRSTPGPTTLVRSRYVMLDRLQAGSQKILEQSRELREHTDQSGATRRLVIWSHSPRLLSETSLTLSLKVIPVVSDL